MSNFFNGGTNTFDNFDWRNPRLQEPDLHPILGHPRWWHHHGAKMFISLEPEHTKYGLLVMMSRAAAVALIKRNDNPTWFVDWHVKHSAEEFTQGRTVMYDFMLKSAFGLDENPGKYGQSVLNEWGGDSAEQGIYYDTITF